jgi:hypothetical protein
MPTKTVTVRRDDDAKSSDEARAASDAEHRQWQSDLLDEALLETFPASDSVSIGGVK